VVEEEKQSLHSFIKAIGRKKRKEKEEEISDLNFERTNERRENLFTIANGKRQYACELIFIRMP